MATRTKKTPMSETHKEALAEGRNHARVVGSYLDALEANKPKRGRKRTPDSVKKRLGTGSTCRAFLAHNERTGKDEVLKVGLSDEKGARLAHEARVLRPLTDSRVIRLAARNRCRSPTVR